MDSVNFWQLEENDFMYNSKEEHAYTTSSLNGRLLCQSNSVFFQKETQMGILPGRSLAEGKILSWICLLSLRSSSAVMGRSKMSLIIWQASSAFLPITNDFSAHVYCFWKRSHISWKATVYSRSVSKMRIKTKKINIILPQSLLKNDPNTCHF